jgi:glutamate-1-semialdehyde 2,1-aminomutase
LSPESYKEFILKADKLEAGLKEAAQKYEIPFTVNRAGSMIGFFFTNEEVVDYESAKTSNLDYFATFYNEMLEQGVFLPPSQFEGLFLSTALSEDDIVHTIKAAEIAFSKLK